MIEDFISKRFSPYAFSDKTVSEEQIKILFEAARWAPSSFNEQPWRFIYALKEEEPAFNKFVNILLEINKIWAKYAPVIGLSLAKKTFSYNGKPNKFAQHDTGLAMGGLLAQATFMGLKVHQMGGYDEEKARADLAIPEDFSPMAMFVIGYSGNPASLPEMIQKKDSRARTRNEMSSFLYKNVFDRK